MKYRNLKEEKAIGLMCYINPMAFDKSIGIYLSNFQLSIKTFSFSKTK